MSKKTSYLLGILLTIIVGTYLNWKLCCNCDKATNKVENNVVATPKETTSFPFIVKDADGNLSLNLNDNFNFKNSSAKFESPIPENLQQEIEKLKNYLTTNEGKSLAIKGFYTGDEKNNSAFPNLGIARANSVKNFLVSKGIPSSIIDLFGELKPTMVANKDKVYQGAVGFEVSKAVDNTEALKVIGENIKANPLVLYFKTGQAQINLSAEQRQKIADIVRYLDKVPDAKCVITGHTDNTGDPEKNVVLGQQRADFAKNYLVRNGISDTKIVATSKGQNQPIADNATDEGKAKNRRTVITIQ